MVRTRKSATLSERPATIGDSGGIEETADGNQPTTVTSVLKNSDPKQKKRSRQAPSGTNNTPAQNSNNSQEKEPATRNQKARTQRDNAPTSTSTNSEPTTSAAVRETEDPNLETNRSSQESEKKASSATSTNQSSVWLSEDTDTDDETEDLPPTQNKKRRRLSPTDPHWTQSLQQFLQAQSQNQIRMCKFAGGPNEDFDLWLNEFEALVARNGMNEIRALHLLRDSLKGEALSTFSGLPQNLVSTFTRARAQMSRLYYNRVSLVEWKTKLRTAKMLPEEGVRKFAQRIHKMVLKAHPNADEETLEEFLVEYFINGLRNDLRKRLQIRNPTDIETAINKAIKYDADTKATSSAKATLNLAELATESSTENEESEIRESNKQKRQREKLLLMRPGPTNANNNRNYSSTCEPTNTTTVDRTHYRPETDNHKATPQQPPYNKPPTYGVYEHAYPPYAPTFPTFPGYIPQPPHVANHNPFQPHPVNFNSATTLPYPPYAQGVPTPPVTMEHHSTDYRPSRDRKSHYIRGPDSTHHRRAHSERKCFECQSTQHLKRDCPLLRNFTPQHHSKGNAGPDSGYHSQRNSEDNQSNHLNA